MGVSRISLLLALGATCLWADPAGDPPPIKSEASATVTVTAEGTPVEVVQTPNPIVIIDKATIEAQGADNLGDLLQMILPGQVFASGGVGTATSLSLGGGRPQDTVVTLDGIRLDDTAGLGGVNLAFISLAGIERIEVQQGPCSTRFGSDAQAGAVAMYSAGHAPEGFKGQVRAGIGSQDIRQGAFAPSYGWGSGWVRGSFSAQQEDGATPADNPYRSSGAFIGLGQQLGADTLLTANYLDAYAGVPLPIVYVTAPPRSASQYDPARHDFSHLQVLSASLRSALTPDITAELNVGQALQVRLEPNGYTNLTTDRYLSRRNQANGNLTWKGTPAGTLQIGFDASEEDAHAATASGPAAGRHLALFLEDQVEVTRDLRVVGSVRAEHDRLTFPTGAGGNQDDAASHGTYKLGVNYLLGGGCRFYASTGTAFANPLLFQTIYNAEYQGQTLANERSTTWQTGLTCERGPWNAALALSQTQYDSLIFYNPSVGPVVDQFGDQSGNYQNGSDLRLRSAQFSLGYSTRQWALQGFYRNQDFSDLNAAPGLQYLNDAVIRHPFQTLGLTGHRSFGALRLDGHWSWTGPRYDYGVPNVTDPAAGTGPFKQHFNDLGVAASYGLRKDLVLVLRGDHLLTPRTSQAQWLAGTRDFQNDATQIYGFPAQPATITLEARYRF
jgi:vitamin B12 transporter